jgi:hypothetical protein
MEFAKSESEGVIDRGSLPFAGLSWSAAAPVQTQALEMLPLEAAPE